MSIHTQEVMDYLDYLKHRDEFKQWLKMKNEPKVQEVIDDEVILYPPPPQYQDVPEPEPISLLPPKAFQCIPVPKQDEERIDDEGIEIYKKLLEIDNQAKPHGHKKYYIRDFKDYVGDLRYTKKLKNGLAHYFKCKKCDENTCIREKTIKGGRISLYLTEFIHHTTLCKGLPHRLI
jgi:hypothetical protein